MKVSVLMSVYNERIQDLELAINSVIFQSYRNFEFFIVNDNPGNDEIIDYLENKAKEDQRIILINNPKNLGLAMSMNIAAEQAKGEYLIRTDADDICDSNRFSIQVEKMDELKADLICSSFEYIDEDGEFIEENSNFYTSEQFKKLLPYGNIIHHPTVIMRRESFIIVNGYRNFPCSQDYDLWLRLLHNGNKIIMLKDNLLQYRIRGNSVTAKKSLEQSLTIDYIQGLYTELCNNRKDLYNYGDYIIYLNNRVRKYSRNYYKYINKYNIAMDSKKRKCDLIICLLKSSYLRKIFFRTINYKLHMIFNKN